MLNSLYRKESEIKNPAIIKQIFSDNAPWDALLETDAAQATLEQLAADALVEYRAAKTKPLIFSRNGKIIPE